MDNNFWLERWQAGQTGFHQNKVMPLLLKYWPKLELALGSKVLVPLAGKSLDVIWLAEQGFEVTAVELSPLAIEQFFNENKLEFNKTKQNNKEIYTSKNINYICADIFSLEADFFQQFAACYDRAALIALTDDLRNAYVDHVYNNLTYNSKTLLLTIDYPQLEMDGPPFAINLNMIEDLFAKNFEINTLDTRDILQNEPKFQERGLTRMSTSVYLLHKRDKR